jgi:hypothetical protein
MWLRFTKPAILSFIITALFQAAILCIIDLYPYRFTFEIYISLAFIAVLASTIISYRSCSMDKKCKKKMSFQVFIIPPLFLFLGLTGLLFFNTDIYIREIFLSLSGLAYFVIFSEIFSDFTHKAHDGVKFLTIFLLFDSILELVNYYKFSLYFIPLLVFIATVLCLYHMFWRLSALKRYYSLIGLAVGMLLGIFAWISATLWPLASYFILAIMLMSLYYVAWGILHHHIEKNLNKEIVLDYLLIGAFVFLMALGLTFLGV